MSPISWEETLGDQRQYRQGAIKLSWNILNNYQMYSTMESVKCLLNIRNESLSQEMTR